MTQSRIVSAKYFQRIGESLLLTGESNKPEETSTRFKLFNE